MVKHLIIRTFVVSWIFWRYFLPWCFLRKRRAQLLRSAFERLGATYIKLGQIIASSPGLFPEEYSTEFQKCLDRVPAFPFSDVQKIVRSETGKEVEDVFQSLTETPIAAASIAQVHAATLKDGTDVVLKVQRPYIGDRVRADMWFIRKGARMAEFFFSMARLANITGIVDYFSATIAQELDFRAEGQNMDEFNEIMRKHSFDSEVAAPIVYWDYTTRRLLCMERFYGIKADDVQEARAQNIDTEKWLRVGMRAWNMTMMLHRFFHGDVHAGNLMLLPKRNQIGFIDFGIVGRFDAEQRMHVLRYVLAFTTQNYRELANVMVEIESVSRDVDIDAMAADMEELYKPLLERSISDLDYGKILPKLIRNAQKYGVQVPREFILIIKQLLYFDRYAKLSAPNLNVFNDLYLVDFLFTPAAAEQGIDTNAIAQMLMSVQQMQSQQSAPTDNESSSENPEA